MTIKLEATGQDDFLPEDRRVLFAEPRPGNRDIVEVQLQYIDPEDGEERVLGMFRLADLVKVLREVSAKVLELEARFGSTAQTLELPTRPSGLEL
ncbi:MULTISPECIES: hypothetical protein [unclassified Microbacterium]|uniref:hypothetical protein n=1 Tax=unclassified Microbacterium TaxID=2609290 RepID=UPI000EA85941|nr:MULTISPECIES: hypothetical protein [unclassified Microbacterium]MBT2484768.1 hypothetical protein [Microbacterium sp. ISL-108]RKN67644.1 hypothetical protein D7252_08650 [Microbacterium sp. CGR2]